MEEAGLPPGVVNVLPSKQSGKVVSAMLADPRVRKLSFTGSTGVGRTLLKQAADRIVNASMELGGNDPFLVLDDADIDAAVEGAMLAKMRNGGQACTAANRFLVAESVADEFAEKLAAKMGQLRLGPGTDEDTQIGPMVNRRAVDGIADKVIRSLEAGAKAVLGGDRPEGIGFFYPPTVLTNVPRESPVAVEEVFGPVAPIIPIRDDEDGLAIANASELGLTGYVFTRDLARGLRVAERLEVGMVGLNRGIVSDPAAPFGGLKQSGLGREGGFEGIDEYLETTYVATSW
jgi:succinate-semialdehyde dehydrogenase/glutarate-semialdehyde dehydrogenase